MTDNLEKMCDLTISEFNDRLASSEPIPGGGGVAGLAALLADSLGLMVTALTTGKKKYADTQEELEELIEKLKDQRKAVADSMDKDAQVFLPLSKAYGMPAGTPEEKEKKEQVLEELLLNAAKSPIELMEDVIILFGILRRLADIGSRLVLSDVGVGAYMARAAMESAALNVYINTKFMKNKDVAGSLNAKADELKAEGIKICEEIDKIMIEGLK